MQLSKNEEMAYSAVRKNSLNVFRLKDLTLILNINRIKAYNIVKALKKKNAINSYVSGFYSLTDADDFETGAGLNWPSYVSFTSALNYYSLSDNLPKKITFVSVKYKKNQKFEYVCLSKSRFFGYKKEGNIIIAEKEKAIIDSLLFPKYAGGIKEISRILTQNFLEFDSEKLIDYALKIKSKIVLRRLGFILEGRLKKNQEVFLLKRIGKGAGFLDPSIKIRKNLNKKWMLYTE